MIVGYVRNILGSLNEKFYEDDTSKRNAPGTAVINNNNAINSGSIGG